MHVCIWSKVAMENTSKQKSLICGWNDKSSGPISLKAELTVTLHVISPV